MRHILELFPKWQPEIEQLYLESIDFQELCQDYEEVRAIVTSWDDSIKPSRDRFDEYQTLLAELEREISDYLQTYVGSSTD